MHSRQTTKINLRFIIHDIFFVCIRRQQPLPPTETTNMDKLDYLESQSVYILREGFRHFERLCMLWSMGKDSTVLLWLARKAFFNHVPFPLVHIDTGFEIPEALTYRDRLAHELRLTMVVGRHDAALAARRTYVHSREDHPEGSPARLGRKQCCAILRTEALKQTLDGSGPRYRLDLDSGEWRDDPDRLPWNGVIVGARADEEGSRSKERYFSPRGRHNQWDVGDQPPEFWNQFKTDFAPGTHVRIHPLLDWTELDIWEYIEREAIPLIPLYFDQGTGTRYRSLGCWPCQEPIASKSASVRDVIAELRSGSLKDVAERSGRLQDHEGRGGLEELRRDGYM
jgi:sulfate adenylyltransferase subunit 2